MPHFLLLDRACFLARRRRCRRRRRLTSLPHSLGRRRPRSQLTPSRVASVAVSRRPRASPPPPNLSPLPHPWPWTELDPTPSSSPASGFPDPRGKPSPSVRLFPPAEGAGCPLLLRRLRFVLLILFGLSACSILISDAYWGAGEKEASSC